MCTSCLCLRTTSREKAMMTTSASRASCQYEQRSNTLQIKSDTPCKSTVLAASASVLHDRANTWIPGLAAG